MNKIPRFFRKHKTQAGEEVQSPTKDILTPVELDKLKNKIRQEIAAAELRIAYILNRQDRPKPDDKKEIEERKTDIKNLGTKYRELLDPEITVYFAKRNKQSLSQQKLSLQLKLSSQLNLSAQLNPSLRRSLSPQYQLIKPHQ
jgi:hypothetical protein